MSGKLWQISLVTVIVFIFIRVSTSIECYVCQDCESNLNSSHIIKCKSNQDKCVKLVLVNGIVDRTCGDKRKCAGRDRNSKSKRSISWAYDKVVDILPSRRFVRSLLPAPVKKEQDGVGEASQIHCCTENECNTSPDTLVLSRIASLPIILTLLLYRLI